MKRRGFIRMLGAAATAPLLPAIPAAAAPVSYGRMQYALGVFHARTRAHVTVRGLAAKIGISPVQARAIMAEMTSKGVVTPVLGKPGAMRAVSNILRPETFGHLAHRQKPVEASRRAPAAQGAQGDASAAAEGFVPLLAHLQRLCRQQGMRLSSRALGMVA